MKKLIFKKINSDTLFLFILLSFSLGLIVWTIQAVNYLDFVTQDGHGFKTYFLYSAYNFPKIINRLIPFVFFVSIFLILINYEKKNELLIFWTQGITKINFANRIIYLSIILMVIQIFIGAYISPMFQFKSRMVLKASDINFFSSLIKEGKFINAVSGLTIFIDNKKRDGSFKNIFIDDSSKGINKITYAKNGKIVDIDNKKVFRLYDGKVINNKDNKINVFEFKQIDINLSEYSTNTILTPKVQETSSLYLLECSFRNILKKEIVNIRNCESKLMNEINQELFKRFYKPIYIPVIAIICCFLIILPKSSIKYGLQIKLTFLSGFVLLILSETTLRYSTISFISTSIYLIVPLICFLVAYSVFIKKSQNV
tara:strand:- start:1411 stop:2520 length:1110 start_codon:yes stop_codon:yes gene_type:complete